MKHLLTSSLLLTSLTLFSAESQLDLRYRTPKGVGYDKGYASIDYFLCHQWGNPELLFNARGHVFNDGNVAGNIGLGYRHGIKEEKYLLGANLFYDFRNSKPLFANQAGLGFEFLSRNFDVRLNGYMPVGKKNELKIKLFDQFDDSSIIIQEKLLSALPSTEIEFGAAPTSYLYVAAGSYYLFKPASADIRLGDAFGAKARASINLGRYCTLGGAITYDSIFKTRGQGYLSFNIPLGSKPKQKEGGRDLRHLPISRNEIIPFEEKTQRKPLYLGDDEDDLVNIVFVDNMAAPGGTGKFQAPFSSLKEAESHSNPGDIIYVFPGDRTARNMEEGISLKENQIIASSGAPLSYEDVVIPPMTPGINPVITNIHSDQPIISNPGASQLENFHILQPWEYFFGNWDYSFDGGGASVDLSVDHGGEVHGEDHGGSDIEWEHAESGLDESYVSVDDLNIDFDGGPESHNSPVVGWDESGSGHGHNFDGDFELVNEP